MEAPMTLHHTQDYVSQSDLVHVLHPQILLLPLAGGPLCWSGDYGGRGFLCSRTPPPWNFSSISQLLNKLKPQLPDCILSSDLIALAFISAGYFTTAVFIIVSRFYIGRPRVPLLLLLLLYYLSLISLLCAHYSGFNWNCSSLEFVCMFKVSLNDLQKSFSCSSHLIVFTFIISVREIKMWKWKNPNVSMREMFFNMAEALLQYSKWMF